MSLYSDHVRRWKDCRACPLWEVRSSVVLARGKLPCDVLLLGEAPGKSEDYLGEPFVGPAGKLMDSIVADAIPEMTCCCGSPLDGKHDHYTCGPPIPGPRVAFTNLIACIPLDDGKKTEEPPDESVLACAPRLAEFVRIADPRLLVCVGKNAKDWTDTGWKKSIKFHRELPRVEIVHPAAILRMPVAQQDMAIRRCVVVLRNAVENLG